MVITDHHECGAWRPARGRGGGGPETPRQPLPQQPTSRALAWPSSCCAPSRAGPSACSRSYADLIATGTIADVMPLTGENRYIVRRGLAMTGGRRPRPASAPCWRSPARWAGAITRHDHGLHARAAAQRRRTARPVRTSRRPPAADPGQRRGRPPRRGALPASTASGRSIEHDIWRGRPPPAARRKHPTAPIVLASRGLAPGRYRHSRLARSLRSFPCPPS